MIGHRDLKFDFLLIKCLNYYLLGVLELLLGYPISMKIIFHRYGEIILGFNFESIIVILGLNLLLGLKPFGINIKSKDMRDI